MRLPLPRTLKARAIVIFFSVFILSQFASLALFERNRDRTVMLAEATDLADRIIGIVNLANSFPAADRQQILAAAETQFLTMFPEIVSIQEVACEVNDFSMLMSERITAAFDKIPGVDAEICVRDLEAPGFFSGTSTMKGFDVLVFVNFPDNEETVFHTILPEGTSLLKDIVMLYILLVGCVALLMGWYLIVKSTAPLERLAKAADEIGANIDKSPMDERGPLEVSRAAQAFNRMQERLARLIHGQTEMLAAISHDLRSAVTRLQLRVELLNDAQERDGLLRVVGDMRWMIQSVLDFVRGHDPQEPARMVNITALVESLCEDLRDEGFSVDYIGGETALNLKCPATALRRGLHNLIDNAIKYGGSAQVALFPDKDQVVIRVEDNGPGIPENHLEAVFQPFFRLDPSRSQKTPGIGLGLAIARNIVASMGGTLVLRNRREGGLAAEMRFPARDSHLR